MSSTQEERKVITIRGVSTPLYERATRLARELGVTIGEFINEALKKHITILESISKGVESHIRRLIETGEIAVVSSINSITINKKDLEYLDKKVVFRDIKELVFGDDVTDELFKDKVYKIIRVDTVSIPGTMSTILIASKCELVGKVTTRVTK